MAQENKFLNIWRNIHLKSLINNEIENMNMFGSYKNFTPETLKNYNHRNYLVDISLDVTQEELDSGIKLNEIIPSCVTSLSFGEDFRGVLKAGDIPNTIKSLKFPFRFNSPIAQGVLPEGLERVVFGGAFNQEITPGVLPSTLKYIRFTKGAFNQPLVAGALPEGLKTIAFGYDFNQELAPGVLPSTLENLSFILYFNKQLVKGSLPEGLVNLKFSAYYEFPITSEVLPSSLRTISLPSANNRFDLPNNLESVCFGGKFNQPIESIPESLKYLEVQHEFNHPLPSVLPSGLEYLAIRNRDYQHALPRLPSALKSLHLGSCQASLNNELEIPSSLTTLEIQNFEPKLNIASTNITKLYIIGNDNFQTLQEQDFPKSLEFLQITGNVSKVCTKVPGQVKRLHYVGEPFEAGFLSEGLLELQVSGAGYNEPYTLKPNSLPSSLVSIESHDYLECSVDGPIAKSNLEKIKTADMRDFVNQNILPPTLKELEFTCMQQENDMVSIAAGVLPNGLKKLVYSRDHYEEILSNTLPESITTLDMGWDLEQTVTKGVLPSNLHTLYVAKNVTFEQDSLPESVKVIYLPSCSANHYFINNENIKFIKRDEPNWNNNDENDY